MSGWQQDTVATTWVEPCACPAGEHEAWQARDMDGFTAHLAAVYRYDRKGKR